MKRSDRLYQLMRRLRDGQMHTAEAMAQDLGVSVRTIYRDMEVLASSGVPVEGARGQGYAAQAAITLPPLNLTEAELDALHLALAALGGSDMPDMAQAAQSLADKIAAILPEDAGQAPERFGFATESFAEAAKGFLHMPHIRSAIRARQRLEVHSGAERHILRPLHLDYWGRVWTCLGWSESAQDFVTLRVDRMDQVSPLPGLFMEEPGKRLSDWRARQNLPDAP